MSYIFRDRLQSVDTIPLANAKRNESTLLISDVLPHGLLRLKQNSASNTENLYLWKDILVLSAAIFMSNVVYYGLIFNLFALQPSELALTAYTLNFSAQIICSLFLSHLTYRFIGCKMAIMISLLTIAIYAVVQFTPSFATFIPAAILFGCGFVTLRITAVLYGNLLSRYYADSSVEMTSSISHVVFFCVNFIPLFGGIVGVLLPAAVLTSSPQNFNQSLVKCYRESCLNDIDCNDFDLTILNCILTTFGALAPLFVGFFLNPRKELENAFLHDNSSICQQWTAVISELIVTNIRLPLMTFTSGLVWAYTLYDILQAYVLCNYGSTDVSLLATTHMTVFIATILTMKIILKYIDPNVMTLIATIFCSALLLFQVLWDEENETRAVLYFIESSLGLINGIFFVINHVQWGTMKSSGEVTYSVYFALFSLGCVLGLSWGKQIVILTKTYIYLGFVVLSMLFYLCDTVCRFIANCFH